MSEVRQETSLGKEWFFYQSGQSSDLIPEKNNTFTEARLLIADWRK